MPDLIRVSIPKYKILEMGVYPREQVEFINRWTKKFQRVHEIIFDMPIGGAAAHFRFDSVGDAVKIMHGIKQHYYGKNSARFPFKISIYRGGQDVFITKDFK